jgi:hypothetical protein
MPASGPASICTPPQSALQNALILLPVRDRNCGKDRILPEDVALPVVDGCLASHSSQDAKVVWQQVPSFRSYLRFWRAAATLAWTASSNCGRTPSLIFRQSQPATVICSSRMPLTSCGLPVTKLSAWTQQNSRQIYTAML